MEAKYLRLLIANYEPNYFLPRARVSLLPGLGSPKPRSLNERVVVLPKADALFNLKCRFRRRQRETDREKTAKLSFFHFFFCV